MLGGAASTFAAFLSCAGKIGEHHRIVIRAANAFMIFIPNTSRAKTPAPPKDFRGSLRSRSIPEFGIAPKSPAFGVPTLYRSSVVTMFCITPDDGVHCPGPTG